MASANTQTANEPIHTVHSKTNDKSTNLRKNGMYWYNRCCDRFSILRENPCEEFDDNDYD